MTRTITDKLVAAVIEITDLSDIFPNSVLKGRVGLDVRIERGSLSIGERVKLHSTDLQVEDLEIIGIEMLNNHHDPKVVRIFCSKPQTLTFPTGKLEGWSITE